MVRKKISKTTEDLKKKDPVLGKIITAELDFEKSKRSVYEALLESILSQQISVSAARSVEKKVVTHFGGKLPSIKKLLETSDEEFRACGLSRQKISYFKNVAMHFLEENLDEKKFEIMSDQEIIADLTKIKGVGEWTVEMVLMFTLDRPDVFSVKDLGLLNAIYSLYNINPKKYKPKNLKKKILKVSSIWSPHRSLACRYLWNYKDSL